jgi:hypothetical protein
MCKKILASGIKTLHLYTLNMEKSAIEILKVNMEKSAIDSAPLHANNCFCSDLLLANNYFIPARDLD